MRIGSWSRRRWAIVAALVVFGLAAAGVAVALYAAWNAEPVIAAAEAPEARTLPPVPRFLGCGGAEWGRSSPRIWEGEGEPDVAIAFEAVFSGGSPGRAQLEAVRLVLERRGWRAGPWKVALFACTSTPHIKWTESQCVWNAGLYAEEQAIVGLLAPFNSGCAAIQLEALEDAPGGGLASVSGTNTWTCLTRRRAGRCDSELFGGYRPRGDPLYFRVSVHDGPQAAALADLAAREGWKRVYVLDDRESYGEEIADGFTRAAARLGVEIVGRAQWDGRARDYLDLMRAVRRARPDALLLAGLVDENGPRLIRDKVAVLGPNEGPVKLVAPDGFQGRYTIAEARGAAAGMFASVGGLAVERLPRAGREFVAALRPRLAPGELERAGDLLVYRAQSADVLLDAIARSDGTRAGVLSALRETRIRGGLIGDFAFDEHGDATLRWVTVYRAEGRDFVPYRAIDPDEALVEEALRP